MNPNKKHLFLVLIVLLAIPFVTVRLNSQEPPKSVSSASAQRALEMSRASAIFNSVLSGVNTFYVDTLDIRKITQNGINAMLSQLDPYTVYLPESEREDFAFMTTGEYGGIGAYIQEKDSAVYVQSPMPGTPAEKAGLKMGDKFISIAGKSVIPSTSSVVSGLLKGPVGTDVKVVIRRLGESKDREVTLTREKVVVDQVAYSGVYGEGIGFIRLSSFTDKSAQDVRQAYERLQKQQKLKGLILDLRSNSGGVLDDAIKILSMFVPEKTMVLYTEGKLPETSQKYYTAAETVDTKLPLVVLINGGSASASEIVAGTIQDLDRGVLIGSKSFGKGLVQSTRPLPYDGVLKVTISRYHIPSGRCIQQLDYSHRNPDGSVGAVPDSLTKVFHTKNGREVRDGGGIRPDIVVKDESMPSIVYTMLRDGYLFEFSNELYVKKPAPKSLKDIVVTDEDYNAFISYLDKSKFKYGEMSLKALEELRKLAEFEGYEESSREAMNNLQKALTPSLHRDIAPHKEQVKRLLRGLLATHYYGFNSQYAVSLENDPTFAKAMEILSQPKSYQNILHPTRK